MTRAPQIHTSFSESSVNAHLSDLKHAFKSLNETPNTLKDSQLMNLSDIDFLANVKSGLHTRDSAQSQTAIKTNSAYETPINCMKQFLKSNWSVQAVPHPLVNNLNSESDLNSFHIIQKPMDEYSISPNSIDQFNLLDPGDCLDLPDASQEDEPIIRHRRNNRAVIESSDDDSDEMYYSLIIGMFRLEHWSIYLKLPL
jgi:hypothetical protein